MKCRRVRSLFSELYDQVDQGDGVVNWWGSRPAEAVAGREHLVGCSACLQAFGDYKSDLDRVRPVMLGLAAELDRPASAARPAPVALPAPYWARWWGLSAAGLAAAAVAFAFAAPQLVWRPEPTAKVLQRRPKGPPIGGDFRLAAMESSIPMLVAECLDPGYELVGSDAEGGALSCAREMPLGYRGARSSFQLIQDFEVSPVHCDGVRVPLGSGEACLDIGCNNRVNELHWHLGGRCFRLKGDITPADAVEVASEVNRRCQEGQVAALRPGR